MDLPISVHLVRGRRHSAEIRALADRLSGRVGVAAVLADLNRSGHAARVPGTLPTWGFRWQEVDELSRVWWPQGIGTEPAESPSVAARSVLVTSWYSRDPAKVNTGSRVTFVDVTDPERVRYRHVLLVEPFLGDDGTVDVRPVRVHAGGVVWHGPYLFVAAVEEGLCVFRLPDIVRGYPGDGVSGRGYRYLLPLRFRYDAVTDDSAEPMRYSFLSLERDGATPRLVAGEFGLEGRTTRLVRYAIDPATDLLCRDSSGRSTPVSLEEAGLTGMQGAAVVDGTYYVTTSVGAGRRGSVWVGRPGAWREYPKAIPTGPEAIAYGPSTNQLWSLSENPGHRYVFAMNLPLG